MTWLVVAAALAVASLGCRTCPTPAPVVLPPSTACVLPPAPIEPPFRFAGPPECPPAWTGCVDNENALALELVLRRRAAWIADVRARCSPTP